MKLIYCVILALCLSLLLCGPVRAQHTGPYAGAYLGGNFLTDTTGSDNQGSFNLSFDPALQGSVVIGWDLKPFSTLGEGRMEIEYAHRSNPLDTVEFAEGGSTGGGDLEADSLLFNCIGVVRTGNNWLPYVVAGAGAARIKASGLTVNGQPLSDDTATVFAYQLGAGIEYVLTGALGLDLGYRFFGTTTPKFTETGGQKFSADYFSHSVILGLRYGF